jgi:hypothetical protein
MVRVGRATYGLGVTLKADGTRPDPQSMLRISAKVLNQDVDPGWALLEETSDTTFCGWTVYGPGDFSENCLPSLDDDDELLVRSFDDVGKVLPGILDLLDWGNGEFPLLMQAWIHKGVRKWMPWEDFSQWTAE